jgi:hypothetical protein
MGKITRKRYTADFKAKVALDAIKGELTLAELSAKHGIHQTMIANWVEEEGHRGIEHRFLGQSDSKWGSECGGSWKIARQDRSIGGGTEFFGESLRSMNVERRRQIIEPAKPGLSIARQCELVSISRSGFYYQPGGESPFNLTLMHLIDEAFTQWPFYGTRQMARHLRRQGYNIGRNRVCRLIRKMGVAAIYQKPRTTTPNPAHKIYPYLLRGQSHRPPGSSMVRRYHLSADASGLFVFGGDHGLAQPGGFGQAAVQYNARWLLCGGFGGGIIPICAKISLRRRAICLILRCEVAPKN